MTRIRYDDSGVGAPVVVDGAVGYAKKGDQFLITFFAEVPDMPDEVLGDDAPGPCGPQDFTRIAVSKIVMSGQTAHEVYRWLGGLLAENPPTVMIPLQGKVQRYEEGDIP